MHLGATDPWSPSFDKLILRQAQDDPLGNQPEPDEGGLRPRITHHHWTSSSLDKRILRQAQDEPLGKQPEPVEGGLRPGQLHLPLAACMIALDLTRFSRNPTSSAESPMAKPNSCG